MTGGGGKRRPLVRAALWGGALAAAGAAGAVAWAVGSIVWPDPARAFRRHGSPAEHGLDFEDVTLPDGSRGWFIPREDAPLTVIVAHGRSRDRSWMLPLIVPLAERFSVLAFDFPGHGENGYGKTTIGLREARTIHAAVDFLAERGATPLVVHGTSMGGVAALLALGGRHREEVIGVCVDAVFDDLTSILELAANRAHMPHHMHKLAVRLSETMAGYRVEAVRPVDAVAELKVPLLITHGRQDDLIPVHCADRLAEAAGSDATVELRDGGHDEPDHPDFLAAVLEFCAQRAESLGQTGQPARPGRG